MKVGIITIHAVPNYGAMLQAYALSSCLREMGFDAGIVDYRQPALEEYFRLKPRFPFPIKHWLRLRRCGHFVEQTLRKSSKQFRSVEEFLTGASAYDALITGSDQVWFTGAVQYFDRMYFLDFPKSGYRKISYAASVGGVTSFGKFEPKVQHALQSIEYLSVRDSHTESLVAPLVRRNITKVVDPVFLNDFSALHRPKPPLQDPYLLVFGNFSGENERIVTDAARVLGLKTIVTLQYPNGAATRRVGAPGPEEWVQYFRHAEFIITSYFHGAAFCVKSQKPFLSLPTPGRRKKVLALLSEVGLSDRCLPENPSDQDWNETILRRIDWKSVNSVLDRRVSESRQFLQVSLS